MFKSFKSGLIGSVSAIVLATVAHAENFNIPAGDLATALNAYTKQTGVDLIVAGDAVRGARTRGVKGNLSADDALIHLLAGTGFATRHQMGTVIVVRDVSENNSPSDNPSAMRIAAASAPAASGAALETVTVTAQKVNENIQSVPIAVTALSEEQLQAQKIEGGPDLLKAIPNMSFTKTNFTGYSINIRGIGTQAVSVTTDPAVAVAFNSTPFIRNHFFEQEFFDVQDVEVLRGPQGTLYGRNATAGVVNIVSAKPTGDFAGELKAEVGNYDSKRMRGFVNVPIVSDKLDFRMAGAWTMRAGYGFNERTDTRVDGRNLWSTRATLGFNPFASLRGDLVWEHFDENDDRARTGKQLCHRDPGLTQIGDVQITDLSEQAEFSQGCKPGSLYDAGAFGTPNGLSIPFIFFGASGVGAIGQTASGETVYPIKADTDPYGGLMQSSNLRVIDSIKDPKYRAQSDVVEANFDYDVTPNITFTSQTGYNKDQIYSFQDYNRFDTVPVFNDSSGLLAPPGDAGAPSLLQGLLPGGIYCDPQIGCSNSIAGFDISQAKSTQFSQEIRLQSSFDGPLNFSVGTNYTRYKTLEDYYVMYNLITLLAQSTGFFGTFNASPDPTKCIPRFVAADGSIPGFADPSRRDTLVSLDDPVASRGCIYIDPNPVDQINGQGHNYFRSENPYRLSSAAAFGEVYWQAMNDVKVTAGLRYTDDHKIFTPIPSQTLLSSSNLLSGTVDRGYPALPDIKQNWGVFTGRFGADWTPKLPLTDQTMVYAFYSRGYKGGGANPPGIGFSTAGCAPFGGPPSNEPCTQTLAYPATFKPEFVNAFETGSKNTLLGGALVLNGDVFFYDYKDYQVSQIKDRTAVNENFSAKVWGAELESTWQPIQALRFNLAMGYQGSRIADGSQSIDLMDRLQGHEADYVLVKPWVQLASNCVAPKSVVEALAPSFAGVCPGGLGSTVGLDRSGFPNGGAGFFANLGGNELPNQPHFTVSLGAQYGLPIDNDWTALMRSDFYLQTESWARVYNDNPYDRLHGYTNLNLTLDVIRTDGLQFEFYVKNVFNVTAITGAFLNSDDSALTTNIFVTDPRLIGFSITKSF